MNPVAMRLQARRKTKLGIVKKLIAGLTEGEMQRLADELPDVIVEHILTAADQGAAAYDELIAELSANTQPAAIPN